MSRNYSVSIAFILSTAFFLPGISGLSAKVPILQYRQAQRSLQRYHNELAEFRTEFGGTNKLPATRFFLFGMGNRNKLIYKEGVLKNALTGSLVKKWRIKSELILPHDYTVYLITPENKKVILTENNKGVFIYENGKSTKLPNSDTPVILPAFSGYKYPAIMKELNHEVLINIVNSEPLPNFLVYHHPWRRDGAMMAMCLKATGNLPLIKSWVLNLSDPYDHNNGGEAETDNLGETLYLLSLFTDSSHPLVKKILSEAKKHEVTTSGQTYLSGRSDFHEAPAYQTKFFKFGLAALHLPDAYTIPEQQDDYSALFWWDYKKTYFPGTKDASHSRAGINFYPYIDWATDHFHNTKRSPIADHDYPLTWESQASQADYSGMRIIDARYEEEKTASPHTWHAAEVFLYLLDTAALPKVNANKLRLQGAASELIAGPINPAQRSKWLDSLKLWRTGEIQRIKYNGAIYHTPKLNWANSTFIYAQMMAHDRYFYDPVLRKYTVKRYLNDLEKRYGGLDAVLIWPTYPNIGVDNRNQYDLVADMPGGREAVKEMIRDFHKKHVKVFFPIMIWDHGTRRIQTTMPDALAAEMKDLGADGLNGDTMNGVTEDFKDAYTAINYPLALQPEVNLSDLKMLEWNRMSWGYYWRKWEVLDFGYIPGVSLYKWLESRHQIHITDRWAINKTDDLQYAFFNGIGYNTWENVWGIWNQIPERYAAIIKRIRRIYGLFPDVWASAGWEPHFPVLQKGIYASKFPSKNETVFTLVNRDSIEKTRSQLIVPYKEGFEYYNLWDGVKLRPVKNGKTSKLSFKLERLGYAAILEIRPARLNSSLKAYMDEMKGSPVTLSSLPVTWEPLRQEIMEIPAMKKEVSPADSMVLIPGTNAYKFQTVGVMIEGNNLPNAVGVQYPWESHPQRAHSREMAVKSFYIDRYPVTNSQFQKFLQASRYKPEDMHNFLNYWVNGNYPAGTGQNPVTWVSIEDARMYAQWAKKRLPHEWEWQYAAQGNDNRLYPWGPKRDTTRIPAADTTRSMRKPSNVNAFPKGASSFGVMDMTGNVWQWTDEYMDSHTRSAVLKGGSYYHAQTSFWYFPQAQEVNKHAKYLLMSPGMDRAATIGFRCVADK